ncbi:hypothetical protein [Streptomyces sp. NPDC094032]|uniref:hypothetical protein n=1 Tax=Streptomyces sp. NPDC094032 TaxID=3155308 RepID=UPI003327C2C3
MPSRRTASLTAAALALAAVTALLPGEPDRAPGPVADGPVTAAEPFRGSPAAAWADGAAGIVPPEARAVGGMSRSQVAVALDRVADFLVAANLEPQALRGETSLPALSLIDSEDGARAEAQGWLERPDVDRGNPLWLFTRFDPAESRLIGAAKTRGTMTFEAAPDPGAVRIRAVYTFVYPVADAVPGRDRATRAIVRRDVTFDVYDPEQWDMDSGTLTPVAYAYHLANHDCGAFNGVVHPWFGGEAVTPGRGIDPYATDVAVGELPGDCTGVSRL